MPEKLRFSDLYPLVRGVIELAGDDPDREGFEDTPKRFVSAIFQMCSGYETNPEQLLKTFPIEGGADEIVLVRNIEFASLCEHHMLPFTGVAHVAYIPNKRIVGLSKIPRVVDAYAKRFQVQERLTDQITKCLQKVLKPKGVATVTVGKHSCMSCRGVRKNGADMVCSSLSGAFKKSQETRAEFFQLIKGV